MAHDKGLNGYLLNTSLSLIVLAMINAQLLYVPLKFSQNALIRYLPDDISWDVFKCYNYITAMTISLISEGVDIPENGIYTSIPTSGASLNVASKF